MKILIFIVYALFSVSGISGADETERAVNKKISLYPAIEGEVGDKECKDFFGRCMIFQTKKPVFELKDFDFIAIPRTTPEEHDKLRIPINEKLSMEFEQITEQYCGQGKRLSIVYEGKILHSPKLRSKIQTTVIEIDFCNKHLFKILVACFRGEIPPHYNFNEDEACRTSCGM